VAFVACLALVGLWRHHDARQRAALARFVSLHLREELTRSISVAMRRTKRLLFLAAVALLCVALAGPLVGYRWELVSRRGNDIIFALDTSRSMSTPDVKPNRLARAKLAIDDFVNQLGGDAVGIVAFAGSAYLVCPITLDYGAFHESLTAVDTNTIPRGGTNISSAIREAQAALHRRPGSDKILILVTDGEDLEGSALSAAQTAKQQDGLKIFTVGVGTAGGDLIPIPPDQGGGFVKDDNNEYVKSRLDEAALKAIAGATGGFYAPLGAQGEGLETIYKTVLDPLAKHDLASRQQKVYIERYQWPLAASLAALLMSLIMGTRRRSGARRAVPAATTGTARAARATEPAVWGLLSLLIAGHDPVRAAAPTAEEAYRKGDYTAAEQGFAAALDRDPATPTLQYNLGAAQYRAGKFPQAAQAFQQSITKAPSSDPKRLAEQEDAYYNLGNALYRAGQKSAQTAPQETLAKWNDAVKAYETALQLRADDADSKYNRDLVKRKIAELQQNQNKNQSSQNKQGQNQQPNSGSGQSQNQPPGQSQGQPPPTAPQNAPPNGQNNDQKPGQQPPQNSSGSQGNQPPPAAGQKPGASQPPGAAPPKGEPRQDPGNQNPGDADGDSGGAGDRPVAGQMSREEARELLDSVKSDERHAPIAAFDKRDANDEPAQPLKNW
jgi:Ca-activated chloride channel family protein